VDEEPLPEDPLAEDELLEDELFEEVTTGALYLLMAFASFINTGPLFGLPPKDGLIKA
jgi:hypothetical protein